MPDQNNAPELPDRIWLDERTFNGAVGFAHSKQHHPGAWAEYIRADRAAPEGQRYFGPMGIPHWSSAITAPPAAPTDNTALVERHANKQRNVIINRCSTDLETIINGHDPEIGNLNNDVWDRLDKMAVEIEAALASREAPPATAECPRCGSHGGFGCYECIPPACQQEAATVALKLAAERLQRLALGIPSTTPLRENVFEWAEEALRSLKGEQ